MKFGPRTPRFLVAPLVALVALTGCSDTTAPDDTLSIVRLNIGTQTILFDQNGPKNCCDGAGNATLNRRITMAATGTVTARTHLTIASFHRDNGTPIALDPGAHQLRIVTAGPEVTWTPIEGEPFRGNFFRASAGIVSVEMSILHTPSGQAIFGPHTFEICTTNLATSAGGSASADEVELRCAS